MGPPSEWQRQTVATIQPASVISNQNAKFYVIPIPVAEILT